MSERTSVRSVAFASNVVASIPIVVPCTSPACANCLSTKVNTSPCVSTSIRRRVRDTVERLGASPPDPSPEKRAGSSSPTLAKRCPVPSSVLQSTPPTASGSTVRGADSVARSRRRKTVRTAPPRRRRNRISTALGSTDRRRDDPDSEAVSASPPTSLAAVLQTVSFL